MTQLYDARIPIELSCNSMSRFVFIGNKEMNCVEAPVVGQ